jgi:hypothetical protein
MNLSGIKNLVTSKVGRQLLIAQKHSPVLMFGAGVVGITATVVLACKATLKVEEVLDHHREYAKHIKTHESVEYSEDDRNRDMALLYVQSSMKLTKLYAPAVIIGVVSIGCLTGSHIVLTRRNAGLTAAYAALDKGFREYRARVVDEFGEDKDREFRHDTIKVTEVNDKGERVTVTKVNPDGLPSIYARIWDEHSSSWNPEPTYNLAFLRAQQQILTDRLRANGHLFLNEVYDDLGLDRTPAGQIVGWVLGEGDDFVDFGIFNDAMKPEHLAFFTGRENAIWLDFNVVGSVYQKIGG